ncbi:uncharacterized protein C16orf96 homolog isoform X4 [Cygnus olor]|uniref:uncharacterized protein C16orf96 homolog isoform X4 n=1 Tax=Cygnus olor TaxID=8869 RepID=UPI001ADE0348|nr:uncharacterized protein C16orf96 homolog isoform X4 [Cygnus olor]
MSVSVRLAELADVAFRTPNSGSVNAGALHLLLRGLLEHLRPQDASTQVSEDERGLLEPGAGAGGRPRALLLQAEGQPGCPGGSPGTAELPTPRQDVGRPGTDSWQTAQLTKRMEVIEEGMTKVTDKLQAMLTTSCSLKTTIEAFQEELQLLKDNFQKAGLEELRERAAQQDKHSNLLQNILGQMAEVRRELGNFPWQAGVLCSLCRVPTGELSSQELSPEAPQEPAQEAPCRLSWLPERHVAVETCISCHENQLQQRADLGTLKDVATRLEKVQGEVKHLEDKGEKGPDFGREVLSQVGQLQEQCTRLQEAAERLWADTEGTQAQWEQAWRLSKQCHCQGPCFDTSGPAGLKRHHFHPVKCISCDRPLAVAPRPHLVTVRKASLHLQSRPASAGGTNRMAQQLPGRENKGSNQASRGPVSPTRPLSASSSLATACPFGAPADFTCQNGQVDLLGIDGVIYKGRLSSQAANGNIALGRDFPGTKSPQPPAQHAAEKTCRTLKYGSHYVSPYSCAAMRTRTVSSGGRWQAAAGGRTAGV